MKTIQIADEDHKTIKLMAAEAETTIVAVFKKLLSASKNTNQKATA